MIITQYIKIPTSLFLAVYALPALAKTHIVNVSSNSFSPSVVVIEAGDTVRWINDGTGSHNIYAAGRFRCAQGCEANAGNGDPSANKWVSEVTFRVPETIPYECQPHIKFGMVGTVVVNPPDPSSVREIGATVDNLFSPDDITMVEGQVLFLSNQGGEHNFRADDDSLICADGCENDGMTVQTDPTGFPWEIYVQMDEVGVIPFHCANPDHSSQSGIVRVISDVIFVGDFE